MKRNILASASILKVGISIFLPIIAISMSIFLLYSKGYQISDYKYLLYGNSIFAIRQIFGWLGIIVWVSVFYKPAIRVILSDLELIGKDNNYIYIFGERSFKLSDISENSMKYGFLGNVLTLRDSQHCRKIMLNIAAENPQDIFSSLQKCVSAHQASPSPPPARSRA
jgi:hypothetical protein